MAKKIDSLPPLDVVQRFSTREACAYLRTSNATLYNLIAAGQLRVIREGKRTYVPGTEIARLSSLLAV